MKTAMSKMFRVIPVITVLVLGLGIAGCEYYQQEPAQLVGSPENLESITDLEQKITELQGKMDRSFDSDEIDALQEQIEALQKAIDDLNRTHDQPEPSPAKKGFLAHCEEDSECRSNACRELPNLGKRCQLSASPGSDEPIVPAEPPAGGNDRPGVPRFPVGN